MICPNCGGGIDPENPDRDMLWTCSACGKAGCHRCMAQYPGTTACADCRGALQLAAREQGTREITSPGQKREDRIKEIFDASWTDHTAQHAIGG